MPLYGSTCMLSTSLYMMSQWSEMLGFPYGLRAANRILHHSLAHGFGRSTDRMDVKDSRVVSRGNARPVGKLTKPPEDAKSSGLASQRESNRVVWVVDVRVIEPELLSVAHRRRGTDISTLANHRRIVPERL